MTLKTSGYVMKIYVFMMLAFIDFFFKIGEIQKNLHFLKKNFELLTAYNVLRGN